MSETRIQLGKWHYTDGVDVFSYEDGTTKIEGADPSTFKVLKDRYARDAQRAYYRKVAIDGSDGSTFKALKKGYAYDRSRVYFDGVPIAGTSSDLRIAGDWFLLCGMEVFHAGTLLQGFAATAFEVLSGPFARDANSVVFHQAERKSYGACHAMAQRIDDADAPTFTPLGNHYAKDAIRVWTAAWYQGVTLLAGATAASFRVIESGSHEFGIDGTSVWCEQAQVEDADPSTFEPLCWGFARDARNIYFGNVRLPDADAATFHVVEESCWGRDAHSIYFQTERVRGIDLASFEVLDWNEARDGQNIYYRGEFLRKARPQDKPRKSHLARMER